ncbi:DHA2 family efflux MFS transporter permease subunit [Acidipila rosea]|uniref:DHA2 family multidrug resistance protein n=1 Tax=Acidipila rosea TaxID=768535 RepID=A0A4R1LBK0_9BACT|nr:DHA2 family efflux MFS transporter permease subunit [Acidipila rosea]MBW4043570.1 DHA2 family efflux MFS transporter permease subunit [Acidobacteriota bacterium]TCK73869.1 DHA2 family multidrug resistance protein [Acidipila rosea]
MAAATASPTLAVQDQWRPATNPWLIAAVVALAAFMEVLDTSIANVALPHIAGSLGASEDQSTWVLTAYLVANAIVLPMGGWAASVIGRKRFFMLCIIIFTVSSFLCGIANTLPLLLLFRVFQGAGGGGLQPMAQAIMADSFEPSKRGLAFSLYGLVAVLAPSIGPTLGGWITDNYSWNWIFYINIPVGILALILTDRLVEDPPWNKADKSNFFRIDYIGLALLTISMGTLQVMLDKGEEKDWFGSGFIRTFGIIFVATFVALIIHEWYAKSPLMDLKLFKSRNFAVCCFLMLLTGGLLNATTVLQPQFLQTNLGYTATIAGLSLSGGGIALVIVMPFAGQAVSRFPARNLIAFGFFCFALAYYLTATKLSLLLSFSTASWLRVIQMVAIPFVFISVTTAAYFGLPREKSNQISGLINFVRNIGGSILISLTSAEVTERGQFHQNQLLKHLSMSNPNLQNELAALKGVFGGSAGGANASQLAHGSIYNQLQQQSQALAYVDVFYLLCAASVLMIPMAFLLKKNKPGEGSGEIAVH